MATLLRTKPYGLIKSQLERSGKISIAFCTSCPTICKLGKEKVDQLARKLGKDGFNMANVSPVTLGCLLDQVKKQKIKENTIIVWGCDSHVFNLRRVYPKRKIIPALTTVGLMVWDAKKNIHVVKEYRQR